MTSRPARPGQLRDALSDATDQHQRPRNLVDLLLGDRAPRGGAAVVQIEVGLLQMPTTSIQQHRHLVVELQRVIFRRQPAVRREVGGALPPSGELIADRAGVDA